MGKNESLANRASRKLTVDWFREITVPVSGSASARPVHHPGYVKRSVPLETFCTGSTYKGQINALGFCGFGTYVYPHGAVYEGYFRDGQFHGDGTITYPNGDYVEGVWVNGRLTTSTFHFFDGLKFEKPWKYCRFPDRRYEDEGARLLLDNQLPRHRPPKIPPKCYYTGDGYYQPQMGIVYGKNDRVLRVVTEREEIEIKQNYRLQGDEHVPYMEDLYEFWSAGRARDVEDITEIMESKSKCEQRKISFYPRTVESESMYSLNFIAKN